MTNETLHAALSTVDLVSTKYHPLTSTPAPYGKRWIFSEERGALDPTVLGAFDAASAWDLVRERRGS